MDDNSYDAWQFERKPKPVSARVEAGEIISNNISFDDYRSMHQITGASPVYQRIKPPEWVFNSKFRDVILLYAENRLQLYEDGCTRTYEQSSIRLMDQRIVKTAAAVVYRYYKLRENSVDIALALSMKPPAVRQLLARIRNLAKRGARKAALPDVGGKCREVRHICSICVNEFFTVCSFRKYCGVTCKRRRAAQERKRRHALLCPECRMQQKSASSFLVAQSIHHAMKAVGTQ